MAAIKASRLAFNSFNASFSSLATSALSFSI
jgi:hypothetical protein